MLCPRLGAVQERAVRIEAFGDVDTGGERTIPGRRQDDGADLVIGADLCPELENSAHMALLNALSTSGRFRVTVATPSDETSTLMV